MNILMAAVGTAEAPSPATVGLGIIFGLILLLIPALLFKLSARLIEKVDVTLGNAYGVAFVIAFIQGCVRGLITLWAGYVGEDYIRSLSSETLVVSAVSLLVMLCLAYSWLISSSFEISFAGGLRVYFGSILIILLPIGLLLGPAILWIAMMPGAGSRPAVNQQIQVDAPPAPAQQPRIKLVPPNPAGDPVDPARNEIQQPPANINPLQNPAASRRRYNEPIRLPIPDGFIRLPMNASVHRGTKVRAVWGESWYDLTVHEVNPDGTLFVSWDNYNSVWDGDIPRDQVIIRKSILKDPRDDRSAPGKDTEENPESRPVETNNAADSTEDQPDQFRVVLDDAGRNRLEVAKVFGKYQKLELKDALEFVRSTPLTISKKLSKEEAVRISKVFEKLGADVSIELETK